MPDEISISLMLLMKLNILNVYQTNIPKNLFFIFKVQNSIIPRALNQVFVLIDHIYPKDFLIAVSKCVISI